MGIDLLEPHDACLRVATTNIDTDLTFNVPVLVSAQDPEDVAIAIFEAVFVCEGLASGLRDARVEVTDETDNPNEKLVRLSGKLADRDWVIAFIESWEDTLDPDGDGEPFIASDEGSELWDKLCGDSPTGSFRWPELAGWFREAHEQ
jgi:hypothetical protein